jgi:hypothetical protein
MKKEYLTCAKHQKLRFKNEVDPDTGNVEPQKEDCKRCFKKLVERRKTKASGGGATE